MQAMLIKLKIYGKGSEAIQDLKWKGHRKLKRNSQCAKQVMGYFILGGGQICECMQNLLNCRC